MAAKNMLVPLVAGVLKGACLGAHCLSRISLVCESRRGREAWAACECIASVVQCQNGGPASSHSPEDQTSQLIWSHGRALGPGPGRPCPIYTINAHPSELSCAVEQTMSVRCALTYRTLQRLSWGPAAASYQHRVPSPGVLLLQV